MTAVVCSRCRFAILGSNEESDLRDSFTCGYYIVTRGSNWNRFAHPGEKYLCDSCMWADPRFQEVYGVIK